MVKEPKKLYENLPDTPGVYLMKDGKGNIIYVGKAANLRRRVSSYFLRPHDARIEKLVSEISHIDHLNTETAIEALILEAKLIKKLKPPYNIKEKDDKSFLYFEITDEKFPRVLLVRGKSESRGERFGPFVSASSAREALRIIRRLFPFNVHPAGSVGNFPRPCFDCEVGLCPGTCVGAISRADYMKTIKNIKFFLDGKKSLIVRRLEREMKAAAAKLEFEKAEAARRKIFSLRHIQDASVIGSREDSLANESENGLRIEGYDISNISGDSAVGSMVVFENGNSSKDEYRKFRVQMFDSPNDVGMMKEVISRRLNNPWPLPDIILVDGGLPQVNAAKEMLEIGAVKVPVVGIAKGRDRKKVEFIGDVEAVKSPDIRKVLVRVRDEAHRFAIGYHRTLRSRKMFK